MKRSSISDGVRANVRALLAKDAVAQASGRVVKVSGLLIEVDFSGVGLGEQIEISTRENQLLCDVVGFRDKRILVIPLGPMHGILPGALARRSTTSSTIPVGSALLGRVVDAFARPIDGLGNIFCEGTQQTNSAVPAITERADITRRFDTGISVIDGLLTCGRGQRIGIFSGAGVGKSMLVEQISRQSFADIVVIGMIGERGREVRELLTSCMGNSTVIVAATSDTSPMLRVRGAATATAIAEYFRDTGKNVLLVIDSVTRYCMALREIGLSVGELPATKGYPPSVFAALPRLLERVAPMKHGGSITAFYTVLVEGDDLSDPIADSARSLLDGHIVLSREQASRGQFPAVDVLASTSRVAHQVTTAEDRSLMQKCRNVLATRRIVADLQSFGAYVAGVNPEYDRALRLSKRIDAWAAQPPSEKVEYAETISGLEQAMAEDESS